jgi:hypothetical protein
LAIPERLSSLTPEQRAALRKEITEAGELDALASDGIPMA